MSYSFIRLHSCWMTSSFLLGTISAILHRFVQSAMFIKRYRCFRSKPYLFQLSSPFQVLLYMLANCFLRGLNTKTILNAHKMANFKEAEAHHRLKKHDVPQTSQPDSHLAELYFSTFGKLENTIYRKTTRISKYWMNYQAQIYVGI